MIRRVVFFLRGIFHLVKAIYWNAFKEDIDMYDYHIIKAQEMFNSARN